MEIPQRDSQRDFSVAIVGGGICGVLLAVALMNAGIGVDIFEGASRYGEIGTGINLGPNAVRVLDELGVLSKVVENTEERAASTRSLRYKFIMGTDDHELVYTYPCRLDDLGVAAHRANLLDALVTYLDPKIAKTHFNKRCVEVKPSDTNKGRTAIYFSDGTSHEADLVVGADGIKSVVRRLVVGEEVASKLPAYTRTVAYRGLASIEALERAGVSGVFSASNPWPTAWMGKDKHLVTYAIESGKTVNCVGLAVQRGASAQTPSDSNVWATAASKEEIQECYSDFGDDARQIINCLEKPLKWMVYGLYPQIDRYVNGNVVLVGDAAHAMLPHLAAGVGQGIEDVYVLSRLLVHPQTTSYNLPAVLQEYGRVRVPRANNVSKLSEIAGSVMEGYGPSGPSIEGLRADLDNMWGPVWHYDVRKDVEACVARLKEEGMYT
ncbi:FAD/NAD-P-binding domain-containing protein [Gloeopeniophorella convolvens]|nr:FAD/NAD-P-binding domain-containing protein [Gloeopeniophorella convolvens]